MTQEHELEQANCGDGSAESLPGWKRLLQTLEIWNGLLYAVSLPISLTLSWVLFVLGLSLSLLNFALSKPQISKISVWQLPPFTLPMALFALAITISGALSAGEPVPALSSNSPGEAWNALYSLKTLLPYFWAYSLFKRYPQCAGSAVCLMVWTAAIGGIWGSIQQVFDIHPGKFKYLQGTGFLGHPMAFAGQMQIFSMLALGLLLRSSYQNFGELQGHPLANKLSQLSKNRGIFAAITIANFSGLFFAGERSAWLGGIAAILAITILRSYKLALKSVLGLAAFSGIAWFTIPLLRTRVESIFSGHDVSVTVRQRIWTECLNNYFAKSPITGIGWRKFPHFDIPEAIVPGVSKDLNHAHSNYVHILTSAGLLGIAAYIYLVFRIVLTAAQKSRTESDPLKSGIALGLFGVAVSLAVSGIFEFNFGTAQVRLAQWFVFGLL